MKLSDNEIGRMVHLAKLSLDGQLYGEDVSKLLAERRELLAVAEAASKAFPAPHHLNPANGQMYVDKGRATQLIDLLAAYFGLSAAEDSTCVTGEVVDCDYSHSCPVVVGDKVCKCECRPCKRAWFDDGQPVVRDGKIVRRK